jgi:DNA-directed RNA polymerase specialized sigma24 family protein
VLEQLVRERRRALVAFGMLLVPRDEAADLVQEALTATFVAHARFESVAHAEGYVRRAMVALSGFHACGRRGHRPRRGIGRDPDRPARRQRRRAVLVG